MIRKIENAQKKNGQLLRRRLLNLDEMNIDALDSLVSIHDRKTQKELNQSYEDNYAEFTKDSEYLFALLGRVAGRKRYIDECDKLIMRVGGLLDVFRASLWQLETICSEMGLSFSGSFVRRRLDSAMMIEQKLWFSRAQRGTAMTNYQTLAKYIVRTFSNSKQEEVRLVYLDRERKVVGKEIISIGEINVVSIELRRLLSYALRADAHFFIVAHNHLGNDVNPSERDLEFTRRVEGAAQMLGIPLFDHLIVCGSEWFSFRIAGLLEIPTPDSRDLEVRAADSDGEH